MLQFFRDNAITITDCKLNGKSIAIQLNVATLPPTQTEILEKIADFYVNGEQTLVNSILPDLTVFKCNPKVTAIYKWLMLYHVSPPSECDFDRKWLADPNLQSLNSGSNHVKLALNWYKRDIFKYDIADLYRMLIENINAGYHPSFRSSVNYMPVVESSRKLRQWVSAQFKDNETEVAAFWTTLFNMLSNTRNGKLNTIYFVGPSNRGKTWFCTTICDAMISYGSMAAIRSGNMFNFEAVKGCKVILWDEPTADEGSLDELKLLLGICNLCIEVIDSIVKSSVVVD